MDPQAESSNLFTHPNSYGSLAQLAEHLTLNQRVTGSSPVRSTKSSKFKASKRFTHILRDFCFGAFFVALSQMLGVMLFLNKKLNARALRGSSVAQDCLAAPDKLCQCFLSRNSMSYGRLGWIIKK